MPFRLDSRRKRVFRTKRAEKELVPRRGVEAIRSREIVSMVRLEVEEE
jgi:hypothetical protein